MHVSRQECLLHLFEFLFEESLERIPSVPICNENVVKLNSLISLS